MASTCSSQPTPGTTAATAVGPEAPAAPEIQQAAFVQEAEPERPPEPERLPEPEQMPEPVTIPGPRIGAGPAPTLEELEQLALSANPSVAEAQALVEAARGKWVQVGLLPNTVVGYSGQQLGSGGQAEQQGVYLGQEIIGGHKLQLNRAVAAREIQRAEQQLAAQRQRVLTDVRLGYYQVLVAQRRNELSAQLVAIAQGALQASEALFSAQEVSKIDVIRARTELQTAQLFQKNAANAHAAAWSRLTAVLSVQGLPPQELAGDLEQTPEEIDPDQVLMRLVSSSPEMAAAVAELERTRWAVDRALAEPVPNVDVQAVVQGDRSTHSSNAVLQVTLPLPWLNRNQGGIRQANAEAVAAQQAVDRLELSLKQRLAGVYQRYANARNKVADYSRAEGILANSNEALDLVRAGYDSGDLSYLDLVTAQRTYFQNNLAYVEALGELWAAIVEMDGMLLKGSLGGSMADESGITQSPVDTAHRPL